MNRFSLNVRLFFEGALLSYVALFRWLRPATYIASKVISPLSVMLFFVFLGQYATGQNNASFYVIGNSVQMTAMSGIFGVTMSIGGDRWNGTLAYLFATPANRMAMFVGRAVVHILDGMIGVFLGFLWGVLIFDLDFSQTDPGALLLTILVTTFSTAAMGLMLGSLSLITRNVMFVNNFIFFLLLIFSGANLEISTLPAWMQTVSQFLPLTRGVASARQVIAGGSLGSVAALLREELLIGLGFLFLGFFVFRWFEYQGKKRGTLEVF